jgi:hypothetical protein
MTRKQIDDAVKKFIEQDEIENAYRKTLDKSISDLISKRSASLNKNLYQLIYRSWHGNYHKFVDIISGELRSRKEQEKDNDNKRI